MENEIEDRGIDYILYCPNCNKNIGFYSKYIFHRTEVVSCSCCNREYSRDELSIETLKKFGVKIPKRSLTGIVVDVMEFFF